MSLTPSAYGKIAVVTCFLASIGDFLVTSLIGFLYKNYNSLTDSQSYLGTFDSPVAVYMNTWEVLLGLLLVTCAYCLFKVGLFKTRMQKFAIWLLVIYGIGEGIGSGLFSFNHIKGELTTQGWFHSIFSGIGITAMVMLSFVLPIIFRKDFFPRARKIFLWYAMTGMVFILLCFLSRIHFLRFVGLWQRLYLITYYLMLITLTLRVSKATVNKSGLLS